MKSPSDLGLGQGCVPGVPTQHRQRHLALADQARRACLPVTPLARQPGMTEQQVGGQAEQRHESDQQQPAARRRRPRACGNPQQGGDPDQPVGHEDPQADVQVVIRHARSVASARRAMGDSVRAITA